MASQRETRLKALKVALQGITTGNGYNQTVGLVKRGQFGFDDFPDRPCIGFYNGSTTIEEFAQGGRSSKTETIIIYGFVDHNEEDFDAVDDLVQDIEARLMTPAAWSYYDWTELIDQMVYEGGAEDNVSYFEMIYELFYEHEWASP